MKSTTAIRSLLLTAMLAATAERPDPSRGFAPTPYAPGARQRLCSTRNTSNVSGIISHSPTASHSGAS